MQNMACYMCCGGNLNIYRFLLMCEQLTLQLTHTHMQVREHIEGLDVIFMLFQLLGAESIPAGSVRSHRGAVHLSEEGRSHWDSASFCLARRHHLAHSLVSPPSLDF